jgi:hypothetical protein
MAIWLKELTARHRRAGGESGVISSGAELPARAVRASTDHIPHRDFRRIHNVVDIHDGEAWFAVQSVLFVRFHITPSMIKNPRQAGVQDK